MVEKTTLREPDTALVLINGNTYFGQTLEIDSIIKEEVAFYVSFLSKIFRLWIKMNSLIKDKSHFQYWKFFELVSLEIMKRIKRR